MKIFSQDRTSSKLAASVQLIENSSITNEQKLSLYHKLKSEYEKPGIALDSSYSKLLNRIGWLEYTEKKNFDVSISLISEALQLNLHGGKNFLKSSAARNYYNLASIYGELLLYHTAIKYYDSCIIIASSFPHMGRNILDCRLWMAYSYFQMGDYTESIDESTKGLHIALELKDTSYYVDLLNQKGQALSFIKYTDEVYSEASFILKMAIQINNISLMASANKTLGYINANRKDFTRAERNFTEAIRLRKKLKSSSDIAADYNDFGEFYIKQVKDFDNASRFFLQALAYSINANDSLILSRIQDNLGLTYTLTGNYKEAEKCFVKSMNYLRLSNSHPLSNPSASAFNLVGNKELILDILMNKSALLLAQFKYNKDQQYLKACLQTALLTDSVITDTRHEQFGEQSKLYWRNRTRSFYTDAMEASFLSQNISYAFYFMEKSRAVLLNDRLNELGARAELSSSALAQNQQLQLEYLKQQANLSQLDPQSAAYTDQVTKVIYAKEKLELFIKSLEKENPVYYQYKYADVVPSVEELQKYLAAGKQSFVQYFMNDTVAYVLTVSPANTSFIKLDNKIFNQQALINFLQSCTNKKLLQNNYNAFAKQSYNLYQTIFQQLHVPSGRTIICPDNILIPFEALCTDSAGRNYLISEYAFSYVYSARYLLTQFSNVKAKANFAGFAPVHFQSSLGLVDLKQSEASLKNSRSWYSSSTLFTGANASKNNFMNNLADYTVVAVLSHAKADNSGAEPVLYMQDSMIHLSELNMLKNVSARLVMLSACQTNVGQNATGEGVYSLARGFAAAGIPALSATLWEADEQVVYNLTEKMNEYLSQGDAKDEALAKAKRFFLQDNTNETTLPYYWANMILIGNAEPLQFSSSSTMWWWAAGIAFIVAFGAVWFFRKKKSAK